MKFEPHHINITLNIIREHDNVYVVPAVGKDMLCDYVDNQKMVLGRWCII